MRKLAIMLAAIMLIVMMPTASALASESVQADTPLRGSTSARINNVQLAVDAIDGVHIGYGDSFSFNDLVGPRTARYGFESAINGRGVKVAGGGVAQVASTIYLALKQLDGIEYDEKQTYGSAYNGKYVSSSRDAILVDYPSIDFRFTNYYAGFVISLWIEENSLYSELSMQGNGRAISSASFEIEGNRANQINVSLAADSINDTQLNDGDSFSFNELVGPRTAKYGYKAATNGRGVKVTGGGVAQVASCIYLAIKNLDVVDITHKSTYGSKYTQDYVSHSRDAILVDYNEDIDFSFRYQGEGTLSIYTFISHGEIVCDIHETFD
ncbi:VanW family protein [Eubacteriales bacterium OttesenSCG-928-N13]|nr:VanW family protein [Eubacteriales bacterium OttesenSCG-928-N13]